MNIADLFINELKHEISSTKKTLQSVPLDKASWKPHDKSMTLGQLSSHVAELPSWIGITLNTSELDWSNFEYKPFVPKTTAELTDFFDKNVAQAFEVLEKCSNDTLQEPWTMRNGEQIYFTLPKIAVLRDSCFNHLIHHRAQLGVYLRLLNIAVPGTYGPTADDQK